MNLTLSPKPIHTHSSISLPHAHPPMKKLSFLRRRLFSISAAAVKQPETTPFFQTPLISVSPAAESLFHITLSVPDNIADSHTRPGQYLQLRTPHSDKLAFLAIANSPKGNNGEFEFLVKAISGSVAEALCGMRKGDVVEVTPALGKGFDIERIQPAEEYPSILIFATGSGISPIRSLIETGFGAAKRPDVRLYYGARNLQRMAYQDRFREWEASGVEIVPVLSQPDDSWTGERGYVQAAFARAKRIYNPQGTGVILCGQKPMAEEVTSLVIANGVPNEKILKNF